MSDYTNKFSDKEAEQFKGLAIISYLGIFWISAFLKAKESNFCKFHANQGIVLFILLIVLNVAARIPWFIGLYFISNIITYAMGGIFLLYFLFALLNILKGKSVELPFIGKARVLK